MDVAVRQHPSAGRTAAVTPPTNPFMSWPYGSTAGRSATRGSHWRRISKSGTRAGDLLVGSTVRRRRMDASIKGCVGSALEFAPDRRQILWRNGNNGLDTYNLVRAAYHRRSRPNAAYMPATGGQCNSLGQVVHGPESVFPFRHRIWRRSGRDSSAANDAIVDRRQSIPRADRLLPTRRSAGPPKTSEFTPDLEDPPPDPMLRSQTRGRGHRARHEVL